MSLTAAGLAKIRIKLGPSLFHLTDAENLRGIFARGLIPGRPSQFDAGLVRADHVYLASATKAREAILGEMDADWGDAILAIPVKYLDPALCDGDEDYWRTSAQPPSYAAIKARVPDMDTPKQVLASLLDGGTMSYRGRIEPASMKLAFCPTRPDLPGLAAIRAVHHSELEQVLIGNDLRRQYARRYGRP